MSKHITYQSVRKLTLQEFLEVMKINPKPNKPHKISLRKRHWIFLIENNILTCPASGKVVSYCSLDKDVYNGSFHYNFYSEDGEMFTIDHKKPISRGGARGNFDNIQPMVQFENSKKGNELIYL